MRLALSDHALEVLAELNGCTCETMAKIWPVASNPTMHEWLEALGAAKAAGRKYRDGDHLFTMTELANVI